MYLRWSEVSNDPSPTEVMMGDPLCTVFAGLHDDGINRTPVSCVRLSRLKSASSLGYRYEIEENKIRMPTQSTYMV